MILKPYKLQYCSCPFLEDEGSKHPYDCRLRQRIIDYTGKKNFEKEPKWASHLIFFRMHIMLNLMGFGCLPARSIADRCFLQCIVYYKLMNICIVKTCDWVIVFMFHFQKSAAAFGFISLLLVVLFGCKRHKWFWSNVRNDRRRKHTMNTENYFVWIRGRQLLRNSLYFKKKQKGSFRYWKVYNSVTRVTLQFPWQKAIKQLQWQM